MGKPIFLDLRFTSRGTRKPERIARDLGSFFWGVPYVGMGENESSPKHGRQVLVHLPIYQASIHTPFQIGE